MKFIGWVAELFEYFTKNYSQQESIEYANDVMNDIKRNASDCIETMEKIRDSYANEIQLCKFCGSDEFNQKTVIEDTDADGRRGHPVTYVSCVKCGNDLDT